MSTRAIRPFGRISWRWVLGALGVTVLLVLCGREVDHGYTKYMLTLIGLAAVGALAVLEPGAFIGVMVLAVMDGIPFVNTSKTVAAHISEQDLACLALVGAALVYIAATDRDVPTSRIARRLSWCGLALVAWCGFTVLRTWAAGDAPLLGASRFGRDFVYFGALLMVLPRLRLSARDLKLMLVILTVGVCLFSVGQFVTVEGIAKPTFIVHATATTTTLGLTRVYAGMNDLLFAGVAFGVAAIVLAPRRRFQLMAIPVTLMLTVSLVVELTRARWIALIVSIVVVTLWIALQGERRVAVRVRRRLGTLVATLCTVIVAVVLVAPSLIPTGTVVTRLLSIFTDIGSSSSTSSVDVRTRVASIMLSILGGKWPMGVGLVPPSSHYFASLPSGSLRDPDVGVLNAVMTIGVVGALLIYLPLVVVLVYSMRRMRRWVPGGYAWLSGGGQIWIVASLVSSITLITLFSVSGLVMSAAILMILSQPVVSGQESYAREVPEAGGSAFRDSSRLPSPPRGVREYAMEGHNE